MPRCGYAMRVQFHSTMSRETVYTFLVLFVLISDLRASGEICQDAICEFNFVIHRERTLTYRSTPGGKTYEVGFNGTHFTTLENDLRLQLFPDNLIGSVVDEDDVITADGHVRNVIVINDQFPGPNLEVMEGSQVLALTYTFRQSKYVTIEWN